MMHFLITSSMNSQFCGSCCDQRSGSIAQKTPNVFYKDTAIIIISVIILFKNKRDRMR